RMPDDSPLEGTANVASALADLALADAAVTSVQSYTGTSSPYTFNGLVRHYFLRRNPNLADLQLMLTPKDDRREQSHAIAKRIRAQLTPLAARLGATIQVVEAPPGPPVLQTLVVVDVDWYVESTRPKWRLEVDDEKVATARVSAADVMSVVKMATSGAAAGLLHDPDAR